MFNIIEIFINLNSSVKVIISFSLYPRDCKDLNHPEINNKLNLPYGDPVLQVRDPAGESVLIWDGEDVIRRNFVSG